MRANGAPAVAPDARALSLARLIVAERDQLEGRPVRARRRDPDGRSIGPLLGGADPDLRAVLAAELREVLREADLTDLRDGKRSAEDVVGEVARRLGDGSLHHHRDALWALLGGDDRPLDDEGQRRPSSDAEPESRWSRFAAALSRSRDHGVLAGKGAALWMNGIIILTGVTTWLLFWVVTPEPPEGSIAVLALKGFAIWCLAFLPCWLYVRFLGQRAGALWDEYVLTVHRLGWDEARFLPRPPRTSQFYDEWVDAGGRSQVQERNIYRQKFNAYYGRSVSRGSSGDDFRVQLDTLFPVLLTVAVLAVCWTAVLWDDRFLQAPTDIWDVLKYGFLGAYAFNVQMLTRRFFASDLRPSAYTSALVRIVVVFPGVAVVYQLLEVWLVGSPEDVKRWQAVIAFVIGFFPLVATQVVVRAAAAMLRFTVRSLDSDYPLSQLDGLNIWYEARLAEENIDDMQNLSTANLIDVILHTRAPVGRLVDWVDQAFLFQHLDRVERGVWENRRARNGSPSHGAEDASEESVAADGTATAAIASGSLRGDRRAGTRTRTHLRQLGIRSATDLLKAFPPDQVDLTRGDDGTGAGGFAQLDVPGLDHDQVRTLVRVLDEEAGLAPVWNWYDRGPQARARERRPRSVRAREASRAG